MPPQVFGSDHNKAPSVGATELPEPVVLVVVLVVVVVTGTRLSAVLAVAVDESEDVMVVGLLVVVVSVVAPEPPAFPLPVPFPFPPFFRIWACSSATLELPAPLPPPHATRQSAASAEVVNRSWRSAVGTVMAGSGDGSIALGRSAVADFS
jgi:hypothetical protein